MEAIDRVSQLEEIQKEALELFRRKNNDYGDAFMEYGLIGIITRLGDKIKRCINIEKTNITLVDNETLRDTLLDLHNYSAMGLMLLTPPPSSPVSSTPPTPPPLPPKKPLKPNKHKVIQP